MLPTIQHLQPQPHINYTYKEEGISLMTACAPVGITSTLPGGIPSAPPDKHFHKDPDLGVIWGNHPDATPEELDHLREIVQQHKNSAFAYQVAELGNYSGPVGPFRIDLKHGQPIIAARRKKSTLEQDILRDKCTELKDAGLIQPAPPNTQYASECVLPVKKDSEGNYTDRRFCVDYRNLNSATLPDHYGMHLPETIFGDVAGSRFFTKVDLRSGFHQIPVAKADQPKTTFWWGNQLYMYTRMPFGARNATAHFQRVMDAEIAGAQLQANACSFVDDILIHSATMKEHIQHVEAALNMLEKCNLKAHPDKTVIAAATVEFLGHNVSAHGLLPNEAKVLAIKALPEPTCVSELRSVLGLLNYYDIMCLISAQ